MIIKGFIGKEGNTLGLSDKPWETVYAKGIEGDTLGTSEKPWETLYVKQVLDCENIYTKAVGSSENPVDKIYTKEIEVENQKPSTPTGAIFYFSSKTPPEGFLICNGAAISRTTYADLFKICGTTFGAGDSSTTFNIPNLIDRFPHGHTTVGTVKAAGLPTISHTHPISSITGLKSGSSYRFYSMDSDSYYNKYATITVTATSANSAVSAIYGKSTTVQPPALTLLPCIKY